MCGVFFSLHFSLVSVVVLTCNELHFIRTKTSVIVCVSHFEQFTTASKSSRHASDVFFPNFSLVCCCFVFFRCSCLFLHSFDLISCDFIYVFILVLYVSYGAHSIVFSIQRVAHVFSENLCHTYCIYCAVILHTNHT